MLSPILEPWPHDMFAPWAFNNYNYLIKTKQRTIITIIISDNSSSITVFMWPRQYISISQTSPQQEQLKLNS